MNPNFEEIFRKLQDEALELHYRWDMYKEIYAGDTEQFEILNSCGSNFFYYVQHLILDHTSLTFSKLTDPDTQGGNENLSLQQIHSLADENGDNELVKELNEIFENLKSACEKFRLLRNKRIAHLDLGHAMKTTEEVLPGISREYVENALKLLREYLDKVEIFYKKSTTGYDIISGPYNAGGKALMSALKEAKKMQSLGAE